LEIEGVLSAQANFFEHTATVTFDDRKTSVEKISEILREKGFYPQGEPKFLE
jgi:copper chaperone CopZ